MLQKTQKDTRWCPWRKCTEMNRIYALELADNAHVKFHRSFSHSNITKIIKN